MSGFMKRSWVTPPQQQLQKEQIAELKLENPEISIEKSLEFLKKLTFVAVSSITYLRNIFPEDAFTVKQLDGQTVRMLRGSDSDLGTVTLINWMKNAFDLITSHQLKKMVLVIQKPNTNTTLEIYTFSFIYNHDEINLDLLSEIDGQEVSLNQKLQLPDNIAKSVQQMIRSILTLTTILHPLPNNCELSMRLYVNENATAEVLPPQYFHLSTPDDIIFSSDTYTLKLGTVESKFTTFALSTKLLLNQNSDEIEEEENLADMEEDLILSSQANHEQQYLSIVNRSQANRNHSCETEVPEPKHNLRTSSPPENLSKMFHREEKVVCICKCGAQFDETIECVSCSTLQHKACYKYLQSDQVDNHVCINCHNPTQGKLCSVPDLLNDVNIKAAALYRQALIFCCNSSQVSCNRIMNHLKVSRNMAEKIFHQLDSDSCFEPATGKGYIRNVKFDYLKNNILLRYFNTTTPDSDSTDLFIELSPPSDCAIVYEENKRHLDEVKENLPCEVASIQQNKRPKLLTTTTMLRNPLCNRQ